ncbi:MAG: hypothetical protein AAGF88_09185 [Pseudomonadota bacterium]
MLFEFPPDTIVIGRLRYERPYHDPISVRAGDAVLPNEEKSRSTDIVGWVWCSGPDGREGWTPRAWLAWQGDQWVIQRDFSALELNVEPGEPFHAFFGESGFLYVENSRGEKGWVPDGTVALAKR